MNLETSIEIRNGNRSDTITNTMIDYYQKNKKVWIDTVESLHVKIRTDWTIDQLRNVKKDAKILDVGSWSGGFSNIIQKSLGFKDMTCVDINPHAIKLGKKTFPNLKFINKSAEDFTSKYKYDVILLEEVLEHVLDPHKIIGKFKNLLRPGGILLITVPTPDCVFGANADDVPFSLEHVSKLDGLDFKKYDAHVSIVGGGDTGYKWYGATIGNTAKSKLCIIIINYETPKETTSLVKSVSKFDKKLYDLIVIDNGSKDKYEKANIKYDTNIGFDQAVLNVLKNNKKDYAGFWLINSDIILNNNGNYLERFISLLGTNKNIGMIGHTIEEKDASRGIVWQNNNFSFTASGGYLDCANVLLSKTLIDNLTFKNTHFYFMGGLDLDLNIICNQNNYDIILDKENSSFHSSGLSPNDFTGIHNHVKSIYGEVNWSLDSFEKYNIPLIVDGWKARYPKLFTNSTNDTERAMAIKSEYFNRGTEVYDEEDYFVFGLHNMNATKDYTKALKYFELIPYGVTNDTNLLTNLGLCHQQLGNIKDAVTYLSLAVDADNHFGINYLIEMLNDIEDFEKASHYSELLLEGQDNKYEYTDSRANYEYYTAQANHFKKVNSDIIKFVFYVVPDVNRPWDAKNDFKLGGSEIATINMSRELVTLGHDVRVFNRCAEPGTYDGVVWDHFDKFNEYEENNEIDILMVSRLPEFRFVNPKTKVFFWAHDLNYYDRITPTTWQYFDKFLVLSRYQYKFFTSSYPYIPYSSYDTIPNGINLNRFKKKKVKRNKKKIIYSSNPDRGLEHLLNWFPELYAWDPEIELHVFSYYPDNITKDPKFFREMPGVIYRGYVDQDQLAKEYMSSGVWVYPSSWLETFCITAIEAQAAGTPAVVSDYACLRDRVGNAGIVIDGIQKNEKHKNRFLNAIKLLMTDNKVWTKYSKAGLEQVKQFTWNEAAKCLEVISRK